MLRFYREKINKRRQIRKGFFLNRIEKRRSFKSLMKINNMRSEIDIDQV